jgi:hypothetical protein
MYVAPNVHGARRRGAPDVGIAVATQRALLAALQECNAPREPAANMAGRRRSGNRRMWCAVGGPWPVTSQVQAVHDVSECIHAHVCNDGYRVVAVAIEK